MLGGIVLSGCKLVGKERERIVPPSYSQDTVTAPDITQPKVTSPSDLPSSSKKQSVEERLKVLKNHLHNENSGREAKELFPDLTPVYSDDGHGDRYFPAQILPFTYYYSVEADITVSICNINKTVFICPGKLERLIKKEDFPNCQVTELYLQIDNKGNI